MSMGTIRKRGKSSWEIRYDLPSEGAKRDRRRATVRGTKADAQRELRRLLHEADNGTLVDPSTVTVAEYLRSWLGNPVEKGQPPPAPPIGLTPKTAERYRQLAEGQVIPYLGDTRLQKLRPSQVEDWVAKIIKAGSRKGRPLAAQTVVHAHRLLSEALKRAVRREVIARNVAVGVTLPKVVQKPVRILTADEVSHTLAKFEGHPLYSLTFFDLGTGLRRGELVGLRLIDLELDAGVGRVCRAVEETEAGLRIKEPKSDKGRRTLPLTQGVIAVLREHRRELLENRVKLGLGKPDDETLVFSNPDGTMIPPNQLSWLWRSAVKSLGTPKVNLHALRHTYASALIAAGLDVVTVQHRMGHASPTTTLNRYGHLFKTDGSATVKAIEAILGTPRER